MGWEDVLAAAQAGPLDLAALHGVVDGLWPGARVVAAEPLLGGLGSVLHRLDLDGAPVDAVVLRQLLEEFGDDADTARREAAVHDAMPRAGVPVPRLWWQDPGGRVLGRPGLLLDFAPGSLLVADLADPVAQDAVARVVHDIAAVPPTGLDLLPRLEDLAAAMAWPFPSPDTSDVVDAARLRAAVAADEPAFTFAGRVVHTDLHGGNVLWDGRTVTAVLDWSGVAFGTPSQDEAYLWLDTSLAWGRPVGDAVQAAVDRARPGAAPAADVQRLWRGVALLRGLPSPAPWTAAYRVAGLDVDEATVAERYVELVEAHLAGS